jgi:hypothetical protein
MESSAVPVLLVALTTCLMERGCYAVRQADFGVGMGDLDAVDSLPAICC